MQAVDGQASRGSRKQSVTAQHAGHGWTGLVRLSTRVGELGVPHSACLLSGISTAARAATPLCGAASRPSRSPAWYPPPPPPPAPSRSTACRIKAFPAQHKSQHQSSSSPQALHARLSGVVLPAKSRPSPPRRNRSTSPATHCRRIIARRAGVVLPAKSRPAVPRERKPQGTAAPTLSSATHRRRSMARLSGVVYSRRSVVSSGSPVSSRTSIA